MLKLIIKLISKVMSGNLALILLYLIVIGMYGLNLYRTARYTRNFGPCLYRGRTRMNKKIFYAIFVLVMTYWIFEDPTFNGMELYIMMGLSVFLFTLILMTSLDVPRIYEKIINIDGDYHLMKNIMSYEFQDDVKEDRYLLKLKIRFDVNKIPYEEYRTLKVTYEQFHKLKALLESHSIKEA